MTATSVLAPSVVTRSLGALQRAVVVLFLVVAFTAAAFTIGRATAPAHHSSPVIAPSAVAVPAGSGVAVAPCRVGPC